MMTKAAKTNLFEELPGTRKPGPEISNAPWYRAKFRWGLCEVCGEQRELRRRDGLCFVCRFPEDRRPLIRAGVPCMTVSALVGMARKLWGADYDATKVEDVMKIVHGRLMENLRVNHHGKLTLKDARLRWIRSTGWA